MFAWSSFASFRTGLFVKFVALRGVPNLSETVPGDYYFIRDASVSWLHVLSWDLAGITDKILFGDYLAKVPRYPNMAYTLLLLVPSLVPAGAPALFPSRPHRQLLGVIYVNDDVRDLGHLRLRASQSGSRRSTGRWPPDPRRHGDHRPSASLTLTITSTIVQVLRFPHRFQLILFMLAPLVMTLTAGGWASTHVSARWTARSRRGDRGPTAGPAAVRLAADGRAWRRCSSPRSCRTRRTARCSARAISAASLPPTRWRDLSELKDALLELPEGKTVVLPPTETAKLVVDANGVDHKFIDKFYIYYLDQPSFYYGLTGDVKNKFEFFLILRGLYYQQDWWVNVARDIGLRIHRGEQASARQPRGRRRVPARRRDLPRARHRALCPTTSSQVYENDSYALYDSSTRPQPDRATLLFDSSWSAFLDTVFTRLDLSRCYDFQYMPYYEGRRQASRSMLASPTTRTRGPGPLPGRPSGAHSSRRHSKIFAFNPDVDRLAATTSRRCSGCSCSSPTRSGTAPRSSPRASSARCADRSSDCRGPPSSRSPSKIPETGRIGCLMRGAATANQVTVRSKTLGLESTVELRSPPDANAVLQPRRRCTTCTARPPQCRTLSVQQLE